jgi:hypothetical protein
MGFEWARSNTLPNGIGATVTIGIMTVGTRRRNGRGCEGTYKVTRGSIPTNGTSGIITIGLMIAGTRRKIGGSTVTATIIMTMTRTLIKR